MKVVCYILLYNPNNRVHESHEWFPESSSENSSNFRAGHCRQVQISAPVLTDAPTRLNPGAGSDGDDKVHLLKWFRSEVQTQRLVLLAFLQSPARTLLSDIQGTWKVCQQCLQWLRGFFMSLRFIVRTVIRVQNKPRCPGRPRLEELSIYRISSMFYRKDEAWRSGVQGKIFSRTPVFKFHFSAGLRIVQREASPLAEHLLLQLDDVVAYVGHHEQKEVEGAGWSLETSEDRRDYYLHLLELLAMF